MAQLENKEKSIDITESLFIRLAPEAREYSARQIADFILQFIRLYINFGSTDDVMIMTCFMVFVKNNIIKKPAVQA